MEFNYYNYTVGQQLNESIVSIVTTIIKQVASAPKKFENKMKSNFKKMIKIIKDNNLQDKYLNILNNSKTIKIKINNFNKLSSLKESTEINEDLKNFLSFWKSETYMALSIFPTLQIWFQIDRLLDGVNIADLNWKKIFVYGTLWVIIVAGQHAILYKKWKREHPDEYNKEGRPGIFTKDKKQPNDDEIWNDYTHQI